MKRIVALIFIVVMLLTLATCGKAPEDILQSESSGISISETIPGSASISENKGEEKSMTNIRITVGDYQI